MPETGSQTTIKPPVTTGRHVQEENSSQTALRRVGRRLSGAGPRHRRGD